MKCKISYVNGRVNTIIENNKEFIDFCSDLFHKKIYFSNSESEEGISIAINTDNILFVEELKEQLKKEKK